MRPHVVFGTAVLAAGSAALGQVCDPLEWRQATPGPGGRFGAAMATDAGRGTVVLFGGLTTTFGWPRLDDTWEWRGDTGRWERRTPAVSPSPRDSAAIGYDPVRGVVVLMGGDLDEGVPEAQDTWEWSGHSGQWTLRAETSPIGPVQGSAMVFEPASGRMVLFGGGSEYLGTLRNDMWEWRPEDGEWRPRAQIDPPPARAFAGMARDPATGKFVLFGGIGASAGADTWEWDGVTGQWALLAPVHSPPWRSFHAVAADVERGKVVVFGGALTSSNFFGDTWEWDGLTRDWQLRTATGPLPREYPAMAYDPAAGRLVLMGGYAPNSALSGTWLYDGASGAWTESPAGRNPVGEWPKVAYDPTRRRIVAASSVSSGPDWYTWEWDGVAWTRSLAPGPRTASAPIVFDGKRVIMFGNTTWGWDGQTWTVLSTLGPPPRTEAGLSYDSDRGVVVLFGGSSYTDTWEWNGETRVWTRRFPTTLMNLRRGHAMAYDPVLRRTLMHGGRADSAGHRDTWSWDGENWTRLLTDGPLGVHHSMYFDPRRQAMVLGGVSVLGPGGWTPIPGPGAAAGGAAYHEADGVAVLVTPTDSFVQGCACYANCDGSITAPVLSVSDAVCFINRFAAGDPYANCDGSTAPPVLNVGDFLCFQARFMAGCP